MKTRIISKLNPLRDNEYDGIKRHYIPQFRKMFKWRDFQSKNHVKGTPLYYSTLSDAKKFIDEVKKIEVLNYNPTQK